MSFAPLQQCQVEHPFTADIFDSHPLVPVGS